MAVRRTYSDRDRAMVAITLQSHDGNVKRTARETGVPQATVRLWHKKWEAEGYPQPVEDEIPAAAEDFIQEATSVRWLMATRLREALERDDVKPNDLVRGIGIFSDKINVMRGLATSRTEMVQVAAPDVKELAKALTSYVDATVDAAKERHDEIQDADWEPARLIALPSA